MQYKYKFVFLFQAPALDDQLSNMLSGLGLGDGAGESNDFIKFMHSMMQTLLTKEILYPTLKTVVDKVSELEWH